GEETGVEPACGERRSEETGVESEEARVESSADENRGSRFDVRKTRKRFSPRDHRSSSTGAKGNPTACDRPKEGRGTCAENSCARHSLEAGGSATGGQAARQIRKR